MIHCSGLTIRYAVVIMNEPLPIALFLAAAKANPSDIFDFRILLALLIGFGTTFLIGLIAT